MSQLISSLTKRSVLTYLLGGAAVGGLGFCVGFVSGHSLLLIKIVHYVLTHPTGKRGDERKGYVAWGMKMYWDDRETEAIDPEIHTEASTPEATLEASY